MGIQGRGSLGEKGSTSHFWRAQNVLWSLSFSHLQIYVCGPHGFYQTLCGVGNSSISQWTQNQSTMARGGLDPSSNFRASRELQATLLPSPLRCAPKRRTHKVDLAWIGGVGVKGTANVSIVTYNQLERYRGRRGSRRRP